MNVSATFYVLRLLTNPSLALPHATVSNFGQLPVPLDSLFRPKTPSPASHQDVSKEAAPLIRAVVLDKDNCFAVPHSNEVFPAYSETLAALKHAYPDRVVIVSNSAGSSSDRDGSGAAALSASTGVPVLSHAAKKPACGAEVMAHLAARGVTHPSQVAVVGDRVSTDVLMANLNGMRAVWVRDGVVPPQGIESVLARGEKRLVDWLCRRGWEAPPVVSPFE